MEGPAQRYVDIDMPDVFELEALAEEGEWMVGGRYEATMFGRLEDGTYVCAGHGGSPLFLR
jgi:hypothetical protein